MMTSFWFFMAGLALLGQAVILIRFRRALHDARSRFDEQAFAMAEANLKLLEQSELLEEQKMRMAEANVTLLEQKEIIEEEQARSDRLLLNVLPGKVAEELKRFGKSEPVHFDAVTVLFSDLVDFTRMAQRIEPAMLINELNEIFTAFDEIAQANRCERIKTIGDAYLCVCGMPEPDPDHAQNVVRTAEQMVRYMRKRSLSSPIRWQIRIGIHSGPAVGGIVGIRKYIYDVFGDTINMASRMESSAEPMEVHLSSETNELVCGIFRTIEKPLEEIKGKGLCRTYQLEESDNPHRTGMAVPAQTEFQKKNTKELRSS